MHSFANNSIYKNNGEIYVYDKNKMTVVTEFVEGTTVLEDLMKLCLPLLSNMVLLVI